MTEFASLRRTQVRTLFVGSAAVLWPNVIVAALVVIALWPRTAQHSGLAAWYGAIFALTFARLLLRQRYLAVDPTEDAALTRWATRSVVGSLTSGLLWGTAAFVWFERGSTDTLLTFTIGGMTAAAAGTMSSYPPAFYGYLLGSLGLLTARVFLEADFDHLIMGAMLVAYGFALSHVVRVNQATFARSHELSVDNAALQACAAALRHGLEQSDRTLAQRVAERSAELEKQGEALRVAQRAEIVGRIAGSVAHEFNNLLTVVLVNTTLVRQNEELGEQSRTAIDEMLTVTRRGAELVRQLLALSGRQRAEPRVLELGNAISELRPVLQQALGDAVRLSLDADATPLHVRIDPSHLEQMLVNLAAHARGAMPSGGQFRIRAQHADALTAKGLADGAYALITVTDSSAGLSPEALRTLFEPFGNPDILRSRSLDLATAIALVQQNGGRTQVDSAEEGGTTLRIYLPCSAENPAPASSVTPPQKAGSRLTLLVADDEPAVRAAVKRSLASLGHQILTARDGEEALSLSREHAGEIHLLITDVVMPRMGGAELARRLTAERPGTAVLFISGYSWGEAVPPTHAAEATGYLQKPFDMATLQTKVSELLARLPDSAARKPSA